MADPLQPLTDDARWALVTGASAGLGKTFCERLARDGYHLVMVARRADRLHALASDLKAAHGTACLVITADLSDHDAPRRITEQVRQHDIFVEVLVNNAGYGVPGRLVEVDWATHRDFQQVMVNAPVEFAWRLLPEMQRHGRGYIINVASVAGLVPGSEGHTLYGASKAYLIRFSESLAREAARHGVHVSALCPGFTYTEFHDVTGTREMMNELPAYLWLSAEEVVDYGLKAVYRDPPRVIAIPGRVYRVLTALVRTFPPLGNAFIRRQTRRFRQLD